MIKSHSILVSHLIAPNLQLGLNKYGKKYPDVEVLSVKWYKRHLTYQIVNWPRHLSPASVRLAVRAAFQLWSNVSGLVFQESPKGAAADIRLAFYDGDHNDGASNAFDGNHNLNNKTYCVIFRRDFSSRIPAERWTLNGHKGHNLFLVTAHEIGHTLGLEHSPVRHALMSPYYRRLGRSLMLSWDDIISVQQLYGETHYGLFEFIYCFVLDQNDTVLVFRGSFFWTVSPKGAVTRPLPLRQRWADLPPAIEAAAFSPIDSKLYFFKGTAQLSILELPRHPDCAFFYAPLGHMILFKGSRYFVLNLRTLHAEPYYPRRLSDWTGVPQGTNGAVTRQDGRLYLFRQQHFWRFDPLKVRVTKEGLWAKDLSWTGCSNSPQSNNIL
uniref:Peptidase metallopeptidase domain-containing protein n=1 Tax=Periophthalmus magnuspinnatus TaxID=409849 RepID=A0A3B4A7Q4_9GOBI